MNYLSNTAYQQWVSLYQLGAQLLDAPNQWRRFRKQKPWAAIALQTFAVFTGLFFLALLIFLQSIRLGAFGPLPQKEDLHQISHELASEVYASDSSLLGRYYFENRSYVPYGQLSPHLIHALIATEDARYYQHHGIDWQAWARVLVKSVALRDNSQGGGSTLSQQIAKNLYPRQDYGQYSLIINKIKEVFVARRLENLYSKEELLELYLNTVPFSENTYGIKVAAHRFFNTSPAALRPEQAAVLVGMLKATTQYNPRANPQFSLDRRNLVLERMGRYGYLFQKQVDSLQALPLVLDYRPLTTNQGLATYFREGLRLELKEILRDFRKENGMGYNLYTDGLKIYTTIDARLQAYAEKAVRKQMSNLQKVFIEHLGKATPWENDTTLLLAVRQSELYRSLAARNLPEEAIDSILRQPRGMTVFQAPGQEKQMELSPLDSIKHYLSFLNAGLLAADPSTGAVKAWVGGIDHKYFQYDHVRSRRQVGSTFKPVVYAKAIQKGIHPCSYIPNQLVTYPRYEGWQPRNADNKYGGLYSMEGGLINSVNTIAVNLAMRSHPKAVAQLAQELGFQRELLGVPAIALGAVEGSLEEMVTVYGTFANRGIRPELYYIRRIETREGKVLIDFENSRDTCQWKEVLTTDQADLINEMLRQSTKRGTAARLNYRYQLPNELAGKTGTSQNHSDGWFMGYNPRLVAGVWVGAEYPAVRFRTLQLGQGANTALPIFAEFMLQVNENKQLRDLAGARFAEPSEEVKSMLNCPNIKWLERDSTVQEAPGAVASKPAEPMVALKN